MSRWREPDWPLVLASAPWSRTLSRRGGEDGAERPRAHRAPPRVSSERSRASAEQLAGRARCGPFPTGRGESGRAGRGWAWGSCWSRATRAAEFLHRLSVLQPPSQMLCVCVCIGGVMGIAPHYPWSGLRWWPRPGYPAAEVIHPHARSKGSLCPRDGWTVHE